jgi:hypothetical protein
MASNGSRRHGTSTMKIRLTGIHYSLDIEIMIYFLSFSTHSLTEKALAKYCMQMSIKLTTSGSDKEAIVKDYCRLYKSLLRHIRIILNLFQIHKLFAFCLKPL